MQFIHGVIHTMEGEVFEDGYLTTNGSVIESVGPMDNLSQIKADAVDLNGASVYPGFIDAHCHIGICEDGLGFEGEDVNEETHPLTPQMRAIDAVNFLDDCFTEAVDAGVTTVLTGPGSANPIGGQWLAMKTYGRCMEEMAFADPVGMKFAFGENPKVSYNAKNMSPMTRMATAALIRKQLQKARNYIEDIRRAEEDDELDEPEFDEKCEALIPVLKGEMKAFMHAHRADDIMTALRIAKEFSLDAVIVHATEGYKIADLLAERDAKIITGPIICDRSKPELKGLTPKNAAILAQHGIKAAVCTDHPVIPIQYLPLSAAICEKEGLSHQAALESITIRAAEIAGIDARVGSLKAGKDADFCVFQDDPLTVSASPSMVVIGGVVVKNRKDGGNA